MTDNISRQAAIDAIYHHFPDKTREECAMVLHEVPSAQPDADLIHLQKEQAYMQGWEDGRASIIRCKDCRWHDNQDGSTAWLPCMTIQTPNSFYCGSAERRTDE